MSARVRKTLMILMASLIAANPILIQSLTTSLLLATCAPLAVFAFLVAVDTIALPSRRWMFAYAANVVALMSMGIYGEWGVRTVCPSWAARDLYTVRAGYPFNKGFLRESLNDSEYSTKYYTNGQGFRIPPIAREDRTIERCDWLVLGDSFTQGAQVNYEELYTSVLQRYFPDKIIVNAGVSGVGIPELYAMARELGTELNPKAIFLQVSTFNDFMNVAPQVMTATEYLLHYSVLARIVLFDLVHTRRERLPLGRWVEPFYPDSEGNAQYNVFYLPGSAQKKRDLESYQHYLQRLVEFCDEREIELILVVIPSKEQANDQFLAEVVAEFKIDPTELDMDRPTKLLEGWLKGTAASIVDVTPAFRAASAPVFFDIDEHPNGEGHALVAAEIARSLGSGSRILGGPRAVSTLFSGARYPSFSLDGAVSSYQEMADSSGVAVVSRGSGAWSRRIGSGSGVTHPVLSPDGRVLAYTQGSTELRNTKVVLHELETGARQYITDSRDEFGAIPQFGRDGRRLTYAGWSFSRSDGAYTLPQVVTVDLETQEKRWIGDGMTEHWRPTFSADGSAIVYIARESGDFDLRSFNLTTGEEDDLTDTPYDEWDPVVDWSGRHVAYAARKDGNWDLFELNLEDGQTLQLTRTIGDEWDPVYSPDGEAIYYAGEFGFSGGVYALPLREARRFAASLR